MKAPVEHMFGCHEWCDREWCWAKDVEETKVDIGRLITNHKKEGSTLQNESTVSYYVSK